MPENLNERVAREVMGWKLNVNASGVYARTQSGQTAIIPDFEHSLDACALAEAEIERRGLSEAYMRAVAALWRNCVTPSLPANYINWFILRLTPAQRCNAMLAAVSRLAAKGKGDVDVNT